MREKPLACAAVPCGSCPYRKDTPLGVWATEEYRKLLAFQPPDPRDMPQLAVFLCHQTNATGQETVCRGWLSVERESVAVRLAVLQGVVTVEQVEAEVPVELYVSGVEAAAAGLAAVEEPPADAIRLADRLFRKGACKRYG